MITAFTVRNFKAIGDEPVRIELKPITLLFGANSVGKSSILHALHYAYEVFNNHNLDVQKITLGENNSLNLGGFKSFIHSNNSNDNKSSIVLNFEFDFDLSFLSLIVTSLEKMDVCKYDIDYNKFFSSEKGYVEVEISWSSKKQYPYVSRYEIGINNERIAVIRAINKIYSDCKNGAILCYFNTLHPIFSDLLDANSSMNDLLEAYIKMRVYPFEPFSINSDNLDFKLSQEDALPNFEKGLKLIHDNSQLYDESQLIWKYTTIEFPPMVKEPDFIQKFEEFINHLLILPGDLVAYWLEFICYLGPLREIPLKNFIGSDQKTLNRQRWATGLAAWDLLYEIGKKRFDDNRLDTINNWLTSESLLNTGYRIVFEHYREISILSTHPLIVALASGQPIENVAEFADEIIGMPEKFRILLHDESRKINLTLNEIGTGISQVLPIVIAALFYDEKQDITLVVIEQPELHIHPAIQVKLGDLFISQTVKKNKFFFIETHSEHLLLRIIRRIKETTEEQVLEEFKILPDKVAIYYVESENGSTQVNRIGLDKNGRFTDRWPKGFFPERMQEMLSSDIRDRVESKWCEKK